MTNDLNHKMEFDHVIEVCEDGSVIDRHDLYAPSLLDGELDSDRWEFFTTGYTGQHGYSGPIMHNSEFIGGRLEVDILATPGVYVSLVSYYSEDADGVSDPDETYVEGWAIARLKDGLDD